MRVYKDHSEFHKVKKAVVTSGTFDGVHLGHQKIINSVVDRAKEVNGESVIITFWPHPRLVLQPNEDIKLLSSLDEKIELISQLKPDHLLIIPFNEEFSQLSSEVFIRSILVEKIGTSILLMGYDNRFGKNREGSFEYLIQHSLEYGFEVEEISRKDLDNLTVSSTNIRAALHAGNLEIAKNLLGRYYTFSGHITKGKQLGRTIGFPTANIDLDESHKLLPSDGVYAVEVKHENARLNGMMNIGFRPTVNGTKRTVEINLFDFDKDIYDDVLQVTPLKKIRNEQKFNSLDELKTKIQEDKNTILDFISTR